ncbi:hypothetical protein HMPREF0972_00015 [Actinomyces sp. oral taxon 848 str. F0332]|nr:hypothetical protein HMPREF0972_00015 [Actinomyces sp. oral taxon 848 str. F0332]
MQRAGAATLEEAPWPRKTAALKKRGGVGEKRRGCEGEDAKRRGRPTRRPLRHTQLLSGARESQ